MDHNFIIQKQNLLLPGILPQISTPIKCPLCKNDNDHMHFDSPRYFLGHDAHKAQGICGWWGRGSLVVVPFWCEDCDGWKDPILPKMAMCFGFHKGNSFMWWHVSENPIPNPSKFSER